MNKRKRLGNCENGKNMLLFDDRNGSILTSHAYYKGVPKFCYY